MTRVLRVTFVTEGDPDRMSGGSLYHRRLVDLAAEEGATVRWVSVPARRFPLAVVHGPAVLRSAAHDADVVVVDSLASNTLGPILTARRARLPPLVGSIHQLLGGSDVAPLRRRLQARSDRLAWRACRALVVPSDRLADDLRRAGLVHPAICVVPPGRDVLAAAGAVPPLGDLRAGRRAAVLCVANWLPRKGIVSLLDAVARLPDDAVTLHLVGDETSDPAYHQTVLARVARAGDRVVRHGIVPNEEIRSFYEGADVFALPSIEEPYGIVYGEAMAAGLPVVGWAAGNLPTLVDDGVEGRVVPVGDIVALAAALSDLALDETGRARLGAAARARSRRLPTWRQTAEGFFAVCQAVRRPDYP